MVIVTYICFWLTKRSFDEKWHSFSICSYLVFDLFITKEYWTSLTAHILFRLKKRCKIKEVDGYQLFLSSTYFVLFCCFGNFSTYGYNWKKLCKICLLVNEIYELWERKRLADEVVLNKNICKNELRFIFDALKEFLQVDFSLS